MSAPSFDQYEFIERPANRLGISSIVAYVKGSGQKGRPIVAAGVNLRVTEDKVILDAISTQEGYRRQGLARELHRRAVKFAHLQGKRLEGTEHRRNSLDEVWNKLRLQREAMEAAGYGTPLESAPAET